MSNKFESKIAAFVATMLLLGCGALETPSNGDHKGPTVAAPHIERSTRGALNIKLAQTKLYAVAPGNWGAAGVGMVVDKESVKIQFDCAAGEIRQQLRMDKKGNFKVDGFYKRGTFGPIRLDNLPKFEPARYEGKITGKVVKFKITLLDTNEVIGEFTVERDKPARLHRCA